MENFSEITCVEASVAAIEEARSALGGGAECFHSIFETATLPGRYDNVVLTHVPEHLTVPVVVLKPESEEWFTEGGRCFPVCPNVNAPSRQVAVKMVLISYNATAAK